jgi:hypothetical protein
MTINLTPWRPDFAKLLAEEGLADRSQWLQPLDEFDEVPIYTRLRRIEFLNALRPAKRCAVLLGYALEYLDDVVHFVSDKLAAPELSEFFVMLTVLNWDDYPLDGIIRPCFWTTSRASEELRCGTDEDPYRSLVEPYSEQAALVQKWVTDLGLQSKFVVLDEPSPAEDLALLRVYVGHRQLPRPEMRSITSLVVPRR